MITLRDETADDREELATLLTVAFAFDEYSQLDEPELLEDLRASGDLWHSLVAISEGGELIGVAVFVRVGTEDAGDWAALGLIAVEPRLQRCGIGRRLMEEGLRRLREDGAAGCVVMAEPVFYARFGFKEMPSLEVSIPRTAPLSVMGFTDEVPVGTVVYPTAFERT